jgi:hypothetical protein
MAARFEVVRSQRDHFAPDKHGNFLELRFPRPIAGPISLGGSAHYGLGLFLAAEAITGTQKALAANEQREGTQLVENLAGDIVVGPEAPPEGGGAPRKGVE